MQIKQWDLVIKPGLKYETYPRVKSLSGQTQWHSPCPRPRANNATTRPFLISNLRGGQKNSDTASLYLCPCPAPAWFISELCVPYLWALCLRCIKSDKKCPGDPALHKADMGKQNYQKNW